MIKRTGSEIDELIGRCAERMDFGSAYPRMSYEEGVYETLKWLLGEEDEWPVPELDEAENEDQ